ncbi:MAG: hypothetical protein ThorAB25_25800 [Candidatus Thorarchaeota archaeon AB_25]|nr:MAG: hypothetical protein ThorAB25_25800 [Candidatus Thorarchaeota archaeon AB_25]
MSDSDTVKWPVVCLGCGQEKEQMSEHWLSWKGGMRNIQKTGNGFTWTVTKLDARTHLCDSCKTESKTIRAKHGGKPWRSWFIRRVVAVVLIIAFILVSLVLAFLNEALSGPNWEEHVLEGIIGLGALFAAIIVGGACLCNSSGFRRIFRHRFNPTSPFLRMTGSGPTFILRNPRYADIIRTINPDLKVVVDATLGEDPSDYDTYYEISWDKHRELGLGIPM